MLSLSYRKPSIYSLAAQQNAYQLFPEIRLNFHDGESEEVSAGPTTRKILRNLTVKLESDEDVLETAKWEIGEIAQGQHVRLQEKPIRFSHEYLTNLTDEKNITFIFTIHSSEAPEEELFRSTEVLSILPAHYWGGESRQPDLLAAFVKPNGVYVESLVKQVTDVLESSGYGRRADGYRSNKREMPYAMAAALWSVISIQKISYVSPPPSFAEKGQLLRLASDISNQKLAACLDLSLLFASCLELMGLNTVIALTNDHAFVGVWLIDTVFAQLTSDDPMELRKRVDSKDLILFESTLVTNSPAATFLQSCDFARSLIDEDREDEFVLAIDIGQARARKIKPLATIEERAGESDADADIAASLPPIPPLPPVRLEEKIVEESPETRIDTWQRKLLDLTKRNPLLSLRDNASAVRIFCPDIGLMEDLLAENTVFSFISAEDSPLNDLERSAESFRLSTGNDLHSEFASEQLEKRILVANMPTKRRETTLINLFRKAKTDLEEGGANTLFIALGMLSWKENPEDERSYKAPLILIPVQLLRKSAKAQIKLKMLPDSEPLFNLTLIQFLKNDYDIDLSRFKDELPSDDYGVDVAGIWQIVRDAISEQPGMELREETLVSSFSFAKYLMWTDLRDRLSDLKENPFVAHLIDKPREAYSQAESFLEPSELDEKLDPSKMYVPLNCDSSQLVAVDAGAKPQDFVLEGPPGTGKSETIANIIANNLAHGRKVLFVAEKIAALQVVYRRLQKICLDHHVLELHSNKANKKAVLDQLRKTADARMRNGSESWAGLNSQLRTKRKELNDFVTALHERSKFGISARQAISRVASRQHNSDLALDWGLNLSDSKAANAEDIEKLIATAKDAGLRFTNLRHFDTGICSSIVATTWTFQWQIKFLESIRSAKEVFDEVKDPAQKFASHFNIPLEQSSYSDVQSLRALSELVDKAQSESIDFALGGNVKDRLNRLSQLASNKADLDDRLQSIKHNVTANKLAEIPIEIWISIFEEAKDSWWKKLIAKYKINKAAREHGFAAFGELQILYAIKEAKQVVSSLIELSEEFKKFNIWKGWDTTPNELIGKKEYGETVHELVKNASSTQSDPLALLGSIKAKLVDARDFLDESPLVSDRYVFESHDQRVRERIQDLEAIGLEISHQMPLESYSADFSKLIHNEKVLKPWVEWVDTKNKCRETGLSCLTKALESGLAKPDGVEEEIYTSLCHWLAPRLISESPPLQQFSAIHHESKIEAFRELDQRIANETAGYVSNILSEKIPDIRSRENAPDFGVLSRELQKKTRHKPIRLLFEELGERILELSPCMMMSPLSVAQFLPSNFNAFDVVVFDEASQMTTWDSVGAIARGKNVIIVGDPKQMPPTNFFNSATATDDSEEEDLESVLDQALAAGLPHFRLMGHYRSKHETLIAFSNSKYYENSLVTYPSSDTKESAVTLRRVNGVYSKGKGRNNPFEAREVVQEVVRRLRHPLLSRLSIGIVTMNSEQQRTIDDLLDDARRKYPEIERYFQASDDYDPVFVKNLESVQGDERDVIIFSLNYGPTEPQGKTMSMNFGPLNKSGGERRLNVAITRATTEVVLFSSFDSAMIDLNRTSALAVEHLKNYMEFAERGPKALAEQSFANYGVDQFDSDFEQGVAWALRDLGWKVQTQVGVSKFRVDLGIIHPDHPGRYLAGVECDGAAYHGSPTARDRDRTRQAVLENLGWTIVRLWSTDYFLDPATSISVIHEKLEQILSDDREKSNQLSEGHAQSDTDPNLIKDDTPYFEDEEDEDVISESRFKPSAYFEKAHKKTLIALAKEILSERPCITEHALALEVANCHGINRTSKKQLTYLRPLVTKWAGKLKAKDGNIVYWSSPEQVSEVVGWRGLSPFGYDRLWSEIAFPEALGLAQEAVQSNPADPVDYICNVFNIKRRSPKTLNIFKSWVAAAELQFNKPDAIIPHPRQPDVNDSGGFKTCRNCNVEKEVSRFYPSKKRADGFTVWCRDCIDIRSKEASQLEESVGQSIAKINIQPVTSKICGSCRQEKSISDFFESTRQDDGYSSWCRDCLRTA